MTPGDYNGFDCFSNKCIFCSKEHAANHLYYTSVYVSYILACRYAHKYYQHLGQLAVISIVKVLLRNQQLLKWNQIGDEKGGGGGAFA